jgi:pimeloyl-ACP methyl ester carboxylesterase
MPQFTRPNAIIHYEVTGSGPPLLLIAGTASDNASWGPLLPLLSGRQLIMPDNRGSGRTESEGPIDIDQIVEDTVALLDHLGFPEADIVGHSLGGMIGLRLAACYPDRVRRLVTLTSGNVPGAKERALFGDMERHYFTMPPEDWFRLLFQWLFSTPFFVDEANIAAAAAASTAYPYRQSPENFARQVKAFDRMAAEDLRQIRCPVLAVAGSLDLLVPTAAVTAGHKGVRNLTLTTLPAAHSIHWEAPQAVADAINGFLD